MIGTVQPGGVFKYVPAAHPLGEGFYFAATDGSDHRPNIYDAPMYGCPFCYSDLSVRKPLPPIPTFEERSEGAT